ncbi:MAG: signal peptidase II [Actinomycetota bacterium]|nr:signal peptidase II [Actinomycetota bacterium]
MANGAADASRTRTRTLAVLGVVFAIVVVDQLTKSWAVSALADGPISIIGDFVELRLTRNPGGAFGRFQGMTVILAVGAIVVSAVLFRTVRKTTDPVLAVGLVLVLGGALGNLSDRIFRSPGVLRGHVVDFVSVGSFPVFNVADSCITVGALLLIFRTLRTQEPEPAGPGPTQTGSS